MSNENVVDYFDRHPSSNECHVTSDNRIFHSKGTADGYANGLADNKVNSHYRSEYEVISTNKVNENTETGSVLTDDVKENEARFKNRVDELIALGFERIGDVFICSSDDSSISATDVYNSTDEDFLKSITPVVVDPPKGEADPLELLQNFNPETASYNDAKAIVKLFELKTPSKKEADLFAAIANHKANINNHEVKK